MKPSDSKELEGTQLAFKEERKAQKISRRKSGAHNELELQQITQQKSDNDVINVALDDLGMIRV